MNQYLQFPLDQAQPLRTKIITAPSKGIFRVQKTPQNISKIMSPVNQPSSFTPNPQIVATTPTTNSKVQYENFFNDDIHQMKGNQKQKFLNSGSFFFDSKHSHQPTIRNQLFEKKNNFRNVITKAGYSQQMLRPKESSSEYFSIQRKINRLKEAQRKKTGKSFFQDRKRSGSGQTFVVRGNSSQIEKRSLLSNTSHLFRHIESPENKEQIQNVESSQWYHKAVQSEMAKSEKPKKIHLSYVPEFHTKIVARKQQKQIGSTLPFPKRQTGFKKRAVSYEIKYL